MVESFPRCWEWMLLQERHNPSSLRTKALSLQGQIEPANPVVSRAEVKTSCNWRKKKKKKKSLPLGVGQETMLDLDYQKSLTLRVRTVLLRKPYFDMQGHKVSLAQPGQPPQPGWKYRITNHSSLPLEERQGHGKTPLLRYRFTGNT